MTTIAYVGDFQQKIANLADGPHRTLLKIGRLASRLREVIQHALGGISGNVPRLPTAGKVSDGVAHPLPRRPQSRDRRSCVQYLTRHRRQQLTWGSPAQAAERLRLTTLGSNARHQNRPSQFADIRHPSRFPVRPRPWGPHDHAHGTRLGAPRPIGGRRLIDDQLGHRPAVGIGPLYRRPLGVGRCRQHEHSSPLRGSGIQQRLQRTESQIG